MLGLTIEEELAILGAAEQATEYIWKRVADARNGTMSAADAIKSITTTLGEIDIQGAADDASAKAKIAAKFPGQP